LVSKAGIDVSNGMRYVAGAFRSDFFGFNEDLLRFMRISGSRKESAQSTIVLSTLDKSTCFPGLGQGLSKLFLLDIHLAQVEVQNRIAGFLLNSLPELLGGQFIPPRMEVNRSCRRPSSMRSVRVYFLRLRGSGDCLIEPAHRVEQPCIQCVCFREVRHQLDG